MYESPANDTPLTQGDIVDACPIVTWVPTDSNPSDGWQPLQSKERVLIMTQACDLANTKATRVQVAVVHDVQRVVDMGIVKAATVRDHIRTHRVWGWYFLPELPGVFPESIVDLRDVHTLPRQLLEEMSQQGRRIIRLATPYREHLAQHFATTFSRIALPEPYNTIGS